MLQVGSVGGEETQGSVPDLEEGKDYEFRVIPVNEAGPGEPSVCTPSIKVKSRRGITPINTFWLPVILKPPCIYQSAHLLQYIIYDIFTTSSTK